MSHFWRCWWKLRHPCKCATYPFLSWSNYKWTKTIWHEDTIERKRGKAKVNMGTWDTVARLELPRNDLLVNSSKISASDGSHLLLWKNVDSKHFICEDERNTGLVCPTQFLAHGSCSIRSNPRRHIQKNGDCMLPLSWLQKRQVTKPTTHLHLEI